ncbi:MAG: N-acetyltransferase [Anaerolineae bacterium]
MDGVYFIRHEEPRDHGQIRKMTIAAFAAAYGTGELEADLVENLRAGPEHDPALALVAVRGDLVVGHVMLSPVTLRNDVGRAWPALVLAPLGVRIGHQRQGIGTALMEAAIAAARQQGHTRIVLSGSPEYYQRHGFEDAALYSLRDELGTPAPHFVVLALSRGAFAGLSGTVVYPATWDGVRKAQPTPPETDDDSLP